MRGTSCRSTSTSAASPTPSCTSSTRASYTRALGDLGLSPTEIREPFTQLFCQGMIRLGGRAMSKSKGNVVAPDEFFETVGADALRLFHL